MKVLNVPIPDELKLALDNYSLKNGINKKKVVELALIAYLKKEELRSSRSTSPA
jgi:metal-responsive CopG/Arc/MetJ family transcriptional regulator